MTRQPRFWVYLLTAAGLLAVFWLYERDYAVLPRGLLNLEQAQSWLTYLRYRHLTARLPAVLVLGALGCLITKPLRFE